MTMRWRCGLSLAGLLALTACIARPVEPTRLQAAAPPEEVAQRIERALGQAGFSVRRVVGGSGLSATRASVPYAWASCPPVLVSDYGDTNRKRMEMPVGRRGAVEVFLEPAGQGTTGVITTRYTGAYRNSIIGYGFDSPCDSTGALEQELARAAAEG
jgi:hypothetical protein